MAGGGPGTRPSPPYGAAGLGSRGQVLGWTMVSGLPGSLCRDCQEKPPQTPSRGLCRGPFLQPLTGKAPHSLVSTALGWPRSKGRRSAPAPDRRVP